MVRCPLSTLRRAVGVVNDQGLPESRRSVDSLVLVLCTVCDLICTCTARFILFHLHKCVVSLCNECELSGTVARTNNTLHAPTASRTHSMAH
jgi:hypothetical protein